jgi:hypothetical protein
LKKLPVSIVALFVSTGLLASSNAAISSVGDPGRSWAQPDDGLRGQHIQQFIDSAPNEIPSFLVKNIYSSDIKNDPTCKSLSDENCAGLDLNYSAVLPKCSSETDFNCVSDFGVINEAGEKTSAVFGRYFPDKPQNEYAGDSSRNLPTGATGGIYTLPQALHDGGDKYYVAAVLTGGVKAGEDAWVSAINVRVTPVALEFNGSVSRSYDAGWAQITDQNTGVVRWGIQGAGYSGAQFCVANSAKESLCAQKYAFPAETRYYVTTRVGKVPGGWMHGRISSPDIQITKGATFSTIDFRGNPIAVPIIYKRYQYSEMPTALKEMYDFEKGGYKPACINSADYCAGGRTGPSNDPLNRNVIIAPNPWDPYGMEQLKLWIPFVEDKATALPSFWSVRTLSANEMSGASQCFADSEDITGIVTTNSTQYSAGPPKFDRSEGTLSYQVAAPHYGTTGDAFKGSYDLVMRSDVARCVYGFRKAPIQATLSITSADGTPQVATTVIGERNGWLYLTAKNFEFSSPVIKAKLSQEAAPTPEPTPTPAAPKVIKKNKTTIFCVKGKITKRVSAVKPKCPTGFKKKSSKFTSEDYSW